MASSFLAGKTALVTGSVQGIGLAIAEKLAGTGARIAVHGLANAEMADAVCEKLRSAGAADAKLFEGDMRDVTAVEAMMKGVAEWGGVDILVNNAGIQKTVSIAEADAAVWEAIIGVNLSGPFHTMRLALPEMARRGYGRVINIASVHGLVASIHKSPYVASKFGLVGLSKAAALEYASVGERGSGGVTVNCICPGWTETAIIEPQIEARAASLASDRATAIRSLLSEKQPSARASDPTEIGELALWLCAPVTHNITGTAIPVDGGWTAQ